MLAKLQFLAAVVREHEALAAECDVAAAAPRSVLLPFECVHDSLKSHPLVVHAQQAPHAVYSALLSLLDARCGVRDVAPEPTNDVRACERCGVRCTIESCDSDGHWCDICGHYTSGVISVDMPYRQFEEQPERSHWQSVRRMNAPDSALRTMVQELAKHTPTLDDADVENAAQRVRDYGYAHKISCTLTMAVASLLISETPDLVEARRVDAKPKVVAAPAFKCPSCDKAHGRLPMARKCCAHTYARLASEAVCGKRRRD